MSSTPSSASKKRKIEAEESTPSKKHKVAVSTPTQPKSDKKDKKKKQDTPAPAEKEAVPAASAPAGAAKPMKLSQPVATAIRSRLADATVLHARSVNAKEARKFLREVISEHADSKDSHLMNLDSLTQLRQVEAALRNTKGTTVSIEEAN